jgi:phage FluMu protein Com
MGAKIEIICPRCDKVALKEKREVTRQTKKNNPIFCSKECAIANNIEKRATHSAIEKLVR